MNAYMAYKVTTQVSDRWCAQRSGTFSGSETLSLRQRAANTLASTLWEARPMQAASKEEQIPARCRSGSLALNSAQRLLFQTSLSMFRNKTFTVRRRFSDFLGLYEKLSEKHGPNGYIVPPPPEKSILGRSAEPCFIDPDGTSTSNRAPIHWVKMMSTVQIAEASNK